MANQQHLDILKQGVDTWNHWWREHADIKVDLHNAELIRHAELIGVNLTDADLSEADLRRTNLSGANLAGANLSGANLSDLGIADLSNLGFAITSGVKISEANLSDLGITNLSRATLSFANLSHADLRHAYLREANLSHANFSSADLSSAILVGANLSHANFSSANLNSAILVGADFSGAMLNEADLRHADLSSAYIRGAKLKGANLSSADLEGATLVGTNFTDAILSGCHIYGISAWDIELTGASQNNLIITLEGGPSITVDNLKIAQFIYLLLNNQEIRDVIDTITSKVVLILGRFTDERKKVLNAIRDELRKQNYLPVLFDFDKPESRDLTETVSTLAHLARFIIVDLTDPSSTPHEVATVIPQTVVPVQPLLWQEPLMVDGKVVERREYAMFEDLRRRYHWVLPTFCYQDTAELLASLQAQIITPAEQKVRDLTPPK